ncbi:MAG: hypothetical protein HN368_07625 [Spirochaetales bacterium]|jgi:hypothetical protein|nr:hypothetical protein [Spirochaetales bacterium]
MAKHFTATTGINTSTYGFTETPEVVTNVSAADRDVIRRLANRKMEIASDPVNLERKALWYKHNGLESSRPMVLAEVQGCMDELFNAGHIKTECTSPWAQSVEVKLKQEIYEFEVLRDDHVIEPYLNVNWIVNTTNHVDESELHIDIPDTDGRLGARRWDPPIKDIANDFEKLQAREYSVSRSATAALHSGLEKLVGDIVPVRIRGAYWWTLGMTWSAIDLIGLENLMMFMYDDPAGLHSVMQFLLDDYTAYGAWLEKEGLLTLNNENDYIGSGGMGYTTELPRADGEPAPIERSDLWALVESQETVGVGPDQFEEFVFPYQEKIAAQYGLCYYGCCEPVNSRWHVLKRIPNIRSVSISPWADEEFMAEALSDNYVYSRKPQPTMISTDKIDESYIRNDIRHTLDVAKGCNVEFLMKDVHTLAGKPERLARWVEIIREEIDNG